MYTSEVVIISCACIWILWNYLNNRFIKDSFSPFNLLFYFWVLPFAASFMKLSELQDGLSTTAISIIAVSTLILVSISSIPMCLLKHSPLTKLHNNDSTIIVGRGPYIIGVFFFITLLAYYWAEFREGIPLFKYLSLDTLDPALHRIGKDSKLQVIAFGIHVAAIFTFYVGMKSTKTLYKFILFILSFLVLSLAILKTSKSDIFIPMLSFSAILYYHYHKQGKTIPRFFFIVLAISIAVLIAITSIRVSGVGVKGGYSSFIQFKITEDYYSPLNEMFAIAYGYSALNFQNFSNYVDISDSEFRIGSSLFRPLLSALMQGEFARELDVPEQDLNVISGAANVGTYLRELYAEGGVIFCLLGTTVYSILVNGIYFKFRRTGGSYWQFVYIIFLFPWVWMFFQNVFSILSIYINSFYAFAVYKLIVASNKKTI
jgi:oligosaccharide repeat unit polymerase